MTEKPTRYTVWVDPGAKTGIVTWDREKPEKLLIEEIKGFETTCGWLSWHLLGLGSECSVGWENYVMGDLDAPWSLEMIGVVRWLATANECQLLQPAAPADRYLGKVEWLQLLGWEKKGCKDDGRSAAQHLLAWLLRTHQLPQVLAEKLFTTT